MIQELIRKLSVLFRRKKYRSDSESSSQKRRTHKNKVKKYLRLIEEFPNSLAIPNWNRKLEYSQSR